VTLVVSIPIIETVTALITSAMAAGGLAALFGLMVVESFGIPPIPSEIILPFAGFLVATGSYSWTGAILAALFGGLVGSLIAYAVGRWGRRWLVERGTGRWRLSERQLVAMDVWFEKHGEPTIILGRLVPLLRAYISYPAGAAKVPPVRFAAYTLIGSFPFAVGMIYLGFVLRSHWVEILPIFHLLDYVVVAALAGIAIYVVLRWWGKVTPGWPPRFTPSTGPPPPAGGAPP
jgi:membrane protein DedA with SNARE-associated domain